MHHASTLQQASALIWCRLLIRQEMLSGTICMPAIGRRLHGRRRPRLALRSTSHFGCSSFVLRADSQLPCRTEKSDLFPASDTIASSLDTVASLRDNVASLRDNVASLRDNVASFRDNVASFRDNVASLRDIVASSCESPTGSAGFQPAPKVLRKVPSSSGRKTRCLLRFGDFAGA